MPTAAFFVTCEDFYKLWDGLLNYKLLSKDIPCELLKPHVHVNNDVYYGYGLLIIKREDNIFKYYLTGSDPGVNFMSSFYKEENLKVAVLSNKEFGAYDISMFVENIL